MLRKATMETNTPTTANKLQVCWKRARSLVHCLPNSRVTTIYDDKIITEQVKKDFIKMVPDMTHDDKAYCIPHHSVKKTL